MDKRKVKILGKLFWFSEEFFQREGFTRMHPVMLGKSVDPLGPDPGSSVIDIPTIDYYEEKLSLVTSMILHKQEAIKHFEKIFVLSPNIRLERKERKESKRHLFEFTQADFEIRGAKMKDVFKLVEKYYTELSKFLKKHCIEEFEALGVEVFEFKAPFKVYTTHELEDKYGKDWEHFASLEEKQPFWAVCHKREFYDKEDEKREGHYLNYDLIYPLGFGEGLSGAEREHSYERIVERIKRDELPLERYKAYLEKAKEGFYPSAGAGIGLERLARFLTRSEHVKEVQAFPRVPGEAVEI